MAFLYGCNKYVIAKRVETVVFPYSPACTYCQYCKHKSGLYQDGEELEQYENFICVLTYETLSRKTVGAGIGKLCPLEFEKEEKEDVNEQTEEQEK